MVAKHLQYCQNIVRTVDYEGYLCSLFVGPSSAQRNAIFAVRALNAEVATIRDQISEIQAGRLRMAWWKEGIDKTFQGAPPNHPVLLTLADALNQNVSVSRSTLKRIVTEREANLTDPQYNSIADLENYAENTVSKLLYLQLEIAGGGESSSASTTSNIDHHQSHLLQADHIASHIGKATGIATLIRSTPHLIQKRLFHLPSQITAKHSLSTEDIFRSVAAGRSDPSSFATTHQALADVVFEVATTANDHLITARTALEKLSGSALIAAPLLNAVPTANYLQRLERANFDIFHPSLHKRDWKLPFKIWRAIRNGKILP